MLHALASTPREDGFRMPAEWEPHAGCYLVWPERPDNWRLGAKPAQRAFARVAEAIAEAEPVTVLVSAAQYVNARERLPLHVRVVEMSTNDAWVRDTGPSFVVNESGELRAVSWQFNAWGGLRGGLYFPWDADDMVGPKVCDLERVQRYLPDLILEGGSIDVDGEGTVLTTEECLLNPNRNPDLGREEIEEVLRTHLGASSIIWLPRGVHLDETDGHIDNFARFAAPGVVMLTWTDDPDDPQWEISNEALTILEAHGGRPEAGALASSGCTNRDRSRSPPRRPPGWTRSRACSRRRRGRAAGGVLRELLHRQRNRGPAGVRRSA